MFLGKGVLKICSKFTGEHPWRIVFNKVAFQLYWNCTSTWVISCKFAAYFQNIFSSDLIVRMLLDKYNIKHFNSFYVSVKIQFYICFNFMSCKTRPITICIELNLSFQQLIFRCQFHQELPTKIVLLLTQFD